jgi:hypothetical protein
MLAHEVVTRLTKRFGLGEIPPIRRRLYSRLAREVEKHGDAVLVIIGEAAQAADRARCPGNWFAAAVTRRLKEAGFLRDGMEERDGGSPPPHAGTSGNF